MLSIVIPSHNEGLLLGETLKAITKVLPDAPHEIIVVDDCSNDGTVLAVKQFYPEVRFLCRDVRMGASMGRIMGAKAAKGDVLCFLDAHVWPREKFFDYLLEGVQEHPEAILSPAITQHKITKPLTPLPEKPRGTNYGGSFTLACRKMWFYCSVNRHRHHWERRPGAYACGMTMTRKTYDKLGGWITLPGYWSSSDVAMCIKCWMMDVPILVETRAHHFHGVKGFGPHFTPKWHEVINRLYAARILFRHDTYESFWYPHLMSKFGRHWKPEWKGILESPEVEEQYNNVRSRAVKTDEEFMEKFVYPRLDKAGLPRTPVKAPRIV